MDEETGGGGDESYELHLFGLDRDFLPCTICGDDGSGCDFIMNFIPVCEMFKEYESEEELNNHTIKLCEVCHRALPDELGYLRATGLRLHAKKCRQIVQRFHAKQFNDTLETIVCMPGFGSTYFNCRDDFEMLAQKTK
jgi:hypothetical protein